MAKTGDTDSTQEPLDFVTTPNRVPAAVMGGLALVFVLGVVLSSVVKGDESTGGDAGVRAVIVPTGDRPRTVAVPPCGTTAQVTARNAAAQVDTPGATVVELPVGARPRVLLVPRCSASTSRAGAKMVAPVPSSVFVLTAGARTAVATVGAGQKKKEKKEEKKPLEPRSQLIVPAMSQATLVVVPPCTGTGSADEAIVLEPRAADRTAVVAPPC